MGGEGEKRERVGGWWGEENDLYYFQCPRGARLVLNPFARTSIERGKESNTESAREENKKTRQGESMKKKKNETERKHEDKKKTTIKHKTHTPQTKK